MTEDNSAAYPLAQMKREAERLHKQHVWVQACLNNRIVFAPIDIKKTDLKVLDVGCADGSLLRDLQHQTSPTAQLVGVDLTAGFLPESPQGNIRYSVGNVCDPPAQDLLGAFDFTHLRYLLVGCGTASIDTPVSNLVATVAPGGWLQVQELDVTLDDAAQDSAFTDLLRILGAIWDKSGPGASIVNKLEDAFVRTALENVKSQRLQLSLGRKLGNEIESRASLEPFKLSIPNISKGARALGVELPASVFEDLEERFEREMLEQGAIFNAVLVYGQKPV